MSLQIPMYVPICLYISSHTLWLAFPHQFTVAENLPDAVQGDCVSYSFIIEQFEIKMVFFFKMERF